MPRAVCHWNAITICNFTNVSIRAVATSVAHPVIDGIGIGTCGLIGHSTIRCLTSNRAWGGFKMPRAVDHWNASTICNFANVSLRAVATSEAHVEIPGIGTGTCGLIAHSTSVCLASNRAWGGFKMPRAVCH